MKDWLSVLRVAVGRKAMICGAVFLGVLLLSLLAFLIAGNSRVKRILFFPLENSGNLVEEERFLPRHGNLEDDIRELVEGEILGPVRHGAARIMPREVTVRSLFVRSRVLYLDLSADFIFMDPTLPVHGADAFTVVRRAVGFNFPRVREIVITIDGQTPQFR